MKKFGFAVQEQKNAVQRGFRDRFGRETAEYAEHAEEENGPASGGR
jgi:hypothetical protein